ncbi:MAG: hypothetical protein ABSB15_07155 [Bryobacteraceae bacterium]|jgi:hypothetical protein
MLLKKSPSLPLADARGSVDASESARAFLSRDCKGAVRSLFRHPARALAPLVLCVACLLLGDEVAPQKVEVVKTEKADLPANGTLRLRHSTGDLTIESWDQPGVEITTTKSSKQAYLPADRQKATKELDRVRISTKRDGDELVVTTEYPRHLAFPWVTPLQTVANFDLVYLIKVPRNSKIVVTHDDGNVYIDDVAGNIQASARQGAIVLRLVTEATPVIDAKSDWGSVNSDFAGKETRRPFPFGHKFVESAAAAQNLHLRIGYGDIVILKAHEPKAPPPLPALAGGSK